MRAQRKLDVFNGQSFCHECGRPLKGKSLIGSRCYRNKDLKRFGSPRMISLYKAYIKNAYAIA